MRLTSDSKYEWVHSLGLKYFPEAKKGTMGYSTQDFDTRVESRILSVFDNDEEKVNEIIALLEAGYKLDEFKDFFSDFKYMENREVVRLYFMCLSWRAIDTMYMPVIPRQSLKRIFYFRSLHKVETVDDKSDMRSRIAD